MPIMLVIDVPGGTTAQYDRANELMGIHDDSNVPEGLIHHVATVDDDGIVVVDIWESQAALDRFFETQLGAALQEAGVPPATTRVFPVHHVIPRGAGQEANVLLLVEPDGFDVTAYDALTEQLDAHAGDGGNHPAAFHSVGLKDDGEIIVADLWGSTDEFYAFARENLADPAEQLGEMKPRFLRVHNRLAPVAAAV